MSAEVGGAGAGAAGEASRGNSRVIAFAATDSAWAVMCAVLWVRGGDEAVLFCTVDVCLAGEGQVATALGPVES